MSSNIRVTRICESCNTEFEAKTTVTKYCSHKCNKMAYKKNLKETKITKSNSETLKTKLKPTLDLSIKEFLSVTDVSKLICCSKQNVYKLINTGKLKATNILQKKTIVKRSELDKLFS